MKTNIEMAEKAGFKIIHNMIVVEGWEIGPYMQRFAALVRADEREAIIPLLHGIDQTECEDPDGWWETSTGAAFGAGILAAIRARGNT